MARPGVVDLGELASLRASMSVEKLAEHFGCSSKTVQRALKRMEDQTPRAVLVNRTQMERAVDHNLSALDEWKRIHAEIDDILAAVKKADNVEGRLRWWPLPEELRPALEARGAAARLAGAARVPGRGAGSN